MNSLGGEFANSLVGLLIGCSVRWFVGWLGCVIKRVSCLNV